MTSYKAPSVLTAIALAIIAAGPLATAQQHKAKLPKSPRPLLPQLAAAGYVPADITYLAG